MVPARPAARRWSRGLSPAPPGPRSLPRGFHGTSGSCWRWPWPTWAGEPSKASPCCCDRRDCLPWGLRQPRRSGRSWSCCCGRRGCSPADSTKRPAAGAHPVPRPLASACHGLWRSLVSASVWGTEGREFKSPQPDNQEPRSKPGVLATHRAIRVTFLPNCRYLDI